MRDDWVRAATWGVLVITGTYPDMSSREEARLIGRELLTGKQSQSFMVLVNHNNIFVYDFEINLFLIQVVVSNCDRSYAEGQLIEN